MTSSNLRGYVVLIVTTITKTTTYFGDLDLRWGSISPSLWVVVCLGSKSSSVSIKLFFSNFAESAGENLRPRLVQQNPAELPQQPASFLIRRRILDLGQEDETSKDAAIAAQTQTPAAAQLQSRRMVRMGAVQPNLRHRGDPPHQENRQTSQKGREYVSQIGGR